MSLWSISFAYRLGLGFHALNNEGADGSNLMQPRRIDVGSVTYDGISGEIIRRHILENFVDICQDRQPPISLLPFSAGIHPDRGPIGIRAAAKTLGEAELTDSNLYRSVRRAITDCAVLDVGGYLAAWKEQEDGTPEKKGYVAEKHYIDSTCANYKDAQPIKRESCFDVAWLISEEPQDLTVTQHSAFRDTFEMNSRYAQTMRTNVYGGVIRADLHRIGTDDYWYLQDGPPSRLAIGADEQMRRQQALIESIGNFIASPTGAKVAGWAPHVFKTEGAILLSSSRTAPFVSPLTVNLSDQDNPVRPNPAYSTEMEALENSTDTWAWAFKDAKSLIVAVNGVSERLMGKTDEEGNANNRSEPKR